VGGKRLRRFGSKGNAGGSAMVVRPKDTVGHSKRGSKNIHKIDYIPLNYALECGEESTNQPLSPFPFSWFAFGAHFDSGTTSMHNRNEESPGTDR
jgi:hypothetical protein